MNDFLERVLVARLKKAGAVVLNNPVAVVAGLIAAETAVKAPTWASYGTAAVTFLVRFLVTGPDGTDIGLAKPKKAKRARKRARKTHPAVAATPETPE